MEPSSPHPYPQALCAASAGLPGIFSYVLEFCRTHCRNPGRTVTGRSSGCLGICQICIPFQKAAVYFIHTAHDDALPGHHAFQLSGPLRNAAHRHASGGNSSGCFLYLPRVYHVPLFLWDSAGAHDAARIDGAGERDIFLHLGIPLGSSGIVSAVVLGFLESWELIEQPLTFLKSKKLWPLSLYLPNISPERAGISFAASVVTLLPALMVFLCGQDYLEQGIVAAAVKE